MLIADVIVEFIPLGMLLLIGVSSFFPARRFYAELRKRESRWAVPAGVLSFFGFFALILTAVFFALGMLGLLRR